jgi:hypothetical protein
MPRTPDLEDDAGDWSADDYARSAHALFGAHPHFGDTAHTRALAEGDVAVERAETEAEGIPATHGLRFYRRGGALVARGVVGVGSAEELAGLRAAAPQVNFDDVHLAQAKRTRTPGPAPEKGRVVHAPHPSAAAAKVDLRAHCSPVGDQGQTLRCDAFAWTHAVELAGNVLGTPFPRLACSYTMLEFLKRQGERADFRRAYLGSGGVLGTWQPGEVLVKHGTCRAALWSNDDPHPTASAADMEADAQKHLLDAKPYVIHLDDAKAALRNGWPIQLSMYTGDAFTAIGRDGVYHMPREKQPAREYHAMLCVGFIGNFFILKNSWGKRWGDQGYCYVPKASVARSSPELVVIELAPNRNAPGH